MRPFLVESPPRIFEPRSPDTEKDFETQVLRVASEIMPGFIVASWKPLIRDWHGHGARPDLAMIARDLESWYVIEVELATHSVPGHIAPQLETLGNGVYDSSLLPSLQRAFPSESTESLTRMVRREPGLLCIADQYTERIWRTCRDTGFELVVLEPYFGTPGGWAVLVEKIPSELTRVTTPGAYSLRRADRLGDSIVLLLPRDFPASFYKIRVPVELGGDEHRFAQVRRFDDGPGIILPLALVPEHTTAKVEVTDPSRQIVQLVLDD